MKIEYTFQPEFAGYHDQFEQAARFWSLFIKDNRTVDIKVEVAPSDGQGGLKAAAAWNKLDGQGLPIAGVIAVDLADISRFAHFTETLVHELGHALGIGTLWQKLKLLEHVSAQKTVFRGRKATSAFQSMTNKPANELLVETGGGASSAGGHWSESAFGKELMTPEKDIGEHIAKFTIASLEDIGYKSIDYTLFSDPKLSSDSHTIPVNKLLNMTKQPTSSSNTPAARPSTSNTRPSNTPNSNQPKPINSRPVATNSRPQTNTPVSKPTPNRITNQQPKPINSRPVATNSKPQTNVSRPSASQTKPPASKPASNQPNPSNPTNLYNFANPAPSQTTQSPSKPNSSLYSF